MKTMKEDFHLLMFFTPKYTMNISKSRNCLYAIIWYIIEHVKLIGKRMNNLYFRKTQMKDSSTQEEGIKYLQNWHQEAIPVICEQYAEQHKINS